jgi:hypothetical protein
MRWPFDAKFVFAMCILPRLRPKSPSTKWHYLHRAVDRQGKTLDFLRRRDRRSTFYYDVTAVLRQCKPYVTELVPDPEFDRLNLPQLHRNLPQLRRNLRR